MIIKYILNTCDEEGIMCEGEISLFYKDDVIVYHHDYSDGALEFDSFESLLKVFGIDLTFESINPTKKQIKEANKYLSENGY